MKLLSNHLATLGGFSTKEVVDRIMSNVFKTKLACQCNWVGKGGKVALKNLAITKAMKDAGRSRATEAELDTSIRLWLKNAHDRDGGRKLRAIKKEARDRQLALAEQHNRSFDSSTSEESD
ncbi:uncharacterized protein LOC106168098 [Lingula anatina]|uniref:Uncharacterized protein LOC106168098 n=1 Tax=Lingula anatina TaxID=7574 RepID=A0A1S3IWZ4_LINAN|nr:uncharacterized protein LOC106168098 [Lingula anatina]|eukprot:XP_013402491.1 uncharacterized protein LOC106168098 [Lingula anatina]